MEKLKQVIIGNGAAGLSAIKAIREIDSHSPITLISGENCNAYSPVSLTHYIKGEIQKHNLFIVDAGFYKANHVEAVFGDKAVGVDCSYQRVYLGSGKYIEYDNLLIATGSSPIGLPGSDRVDNVFSLRTIEDAERILDRFKSCKEVIVIGGGLIGLQVCDGLFREGINFKILEWADHLLPEIADNDSATIIQKEIESRGISIHLGKKVKKISGYRKKVVVTANTGEDLIADMVIIGIGARPNIGLLNASDVRVSRGIWVDEMMRTNIDSIFAAGDVSEGENLVSSTREILLNWSNACKQGKIAGLNMAGNERRYEGGIGENITTLFGLTFATVGLTRAEGNGVKALVFNNSQEKVYRKVLIEGNRVIGAVLIGRASDVGILGDFIRIRQDISPWKDIIARTPLDMRGFLFSIPNVKSY